MVANVVDPKFPVTLNVSVLASPPPASLIRSYMKVSSGDTNLGNGNYKAVTISNWTTVFTGDKSTTETYLWLQAFFNQAPGATAYVLEATTVSDLTAFIATGVAPMYFYSVPSAWYTDSSFVTLVKAHTGESNLLRFAVEITHGHSPVGDSNFTAYASADSLYPIYGNAVATESVLGQHLGRMASSVYDLSSANPMTMLNYKTLNGATAEVLDDTLRQDLNNSGVNYNGEINGQVCIFNGRYADLSTWDFRYNLDWLQITLSNSFITAIVNGSNVPAAALRYDQNGIDSTKSIANGVSNTGKVYGTVTEFGSDYNIQTGQIENKGTWGAISFYTYIADNPSDYAAGIYQGLYAYILIGKFIRKVVLNVTIS